MLEVEAKLKELVIVIGKTKEQLIEEAARRGVSVEELVARLPKDQVQRFSVSDKE